jgi:hypothetical protein
MRVIWLAMAALVCTSGQAVAARPAPDLARSIAWVDDTTERVLFTAADIARFDWERQVFELKREAAMDLEARLSSTPGPRRSGVLRTAEGFVYPDREFSVRDRRGIIYRGALVTEASHVSYPGPAIFIDDLSFRGNPVLRVQGGYPTGSSRTHLSSLLRHDLSAAGVLGRIPASYRPKLIEAVQFRGGDYHGLVVGIKLFPETVRPGHRARLHVRFFQTGGHHAAWKDTQVVLTVRGNQGRFQGSDTVSGPSSPTDVDGAYVIWWDPWKATAESQDPAVKPGLVRVRGQVVLGNGTGDSFMPVDSIAFGGNIVIAVPQGSLTTARQTPARPPWRLRRGRGSPAQRPPYGQPGQHRGQMELKRTAAGVTAPAPAGSPAPPPCFAIRAMLYFLD